VLAIDCEGGMVGSDGLFVATIGLTDIVVIATGKSVFLLHKDGGQRVKGMVT
tara:strand:+ start:1783 stop:1938 length:156 start_codon:yes stop_codon:yes gene_type:complete